MFAAAGWQVLTCKWGRRLQHLFDQPAGADLRLRLEHMSNQEYQWLLRSSPGELPHRLLQGSSAGLRRLLDTLGDYALATALRDLGGHDINLLQQTYRQADPERPTVVFAYTIKGWRLPTEGHPSNHSALLTAEQMRALADTLGADPDDPWAAFPARSPESQLCEETACRLRRPPIAANPPPSPPTQLGRRHTGTLSTQAALGRFLLDLRRVAPHVAARVVTVSPDVASSTNLGGWTNQTGIWSIGERPDWFAGDSHRLLKWVESPQGQHIERGIAETNLVSLLGQLGATWSRHGQPLLPIGTIYDAFVCRALEPWSFAIYSGGQSILIGTPSGVTLAPEGGAHQSITTPSIGLEQPGCTAWEPAFAQDLEWCLLSALANLGKPGGGSAYFRLSTRPIDQNLACLPNDPDLRERRRRHVLAGAYRITTAPEPEQITLVGMGAVMPDAFDAATALQRWGIATGVVCVTSADLLFQALQGKRGLSDAPSQGVLDVLFPPARPAPIVTVLDGHPHTLAFLSSVRGDPITCLGVRDHGQSADLPDSYTIHGIDRTSITGAALDLLDL